jgi:hypothetical protein
MFRFHFHWRTPEIQSLTFKIIFSSFFVSSRAEA